MIMETHHKMTALCAKLGISLVRWQEIVTDTLEKEPGCPKLHCLQVAHLIEANLSLLTNALIARRFIWHAEEHKMFGEAGAGSRPVRLASAIGHRRCAPERTHLQSLTAHIEQPGHGGKRCKFQLRGAIA